ncbi:mercury resistance system transport protein MerF [Jannaschia sp. W003]|uniref:mercury resistance system transport protein MerF n=1 Tax=Jannaschia sp. W003 TaxID=2867012 RepID=UPI0021A44880|nr:mercury resistance system transport protein MerF [Jannaschia sp. W003]UWQ22598.1 mercury resistance system transport protein MerF [Jannaschia sp. W003]
MTNPLLAVGLGGSALAALCCATPLLPAVLAAVGAGGLTGVLYRDAVLLPVLAFFLALAGVALWLKHRRSARS